MTLLLDTHVFIWFVENSSELPRKIRNELENPSNHISVSIASFWELAIKVSIGKLVLTKSFSEIFRLTEENGFNLLPILPEHLIELAKLPFHHRDPFDRLIAAQCITDQFILVSSDDIFDNYNVQRL